MILSPVITDGLYVDHFVVRGVKSGSFLNRHDQIVTEIGVSVPSLTDVSEIILPKMVRSGRKICQGYVRFVVSRKTGWKLVGSCAYSLCSLG